MKKMVVLIFLALFLASCGQSAVRSEFLQHDTMYRNWDHMKFSWFGYNPTTEDLEKTADQKWWGIEVPYVPGQ